MKAWWLGLSARDRRMLVFGAGILFVMLFYALIWHPMSLSIAQDRARVAQLRDDLAWMQAASAKMQALRAAGAGKTAKVRGSLVAAVDRSARRHEMEKAIAQLTPQGDDSVAVSVSSVDFNALLRWIAALGNQGIHIQRLSLTPADKPGQVQATLLLGRGSAG
ncbi:MAG: type II secretion system protein M [Gammaproteobacteria bacterium]|jgi:general secretion pathway protein M